jgi:signal transduction histidine kinase
MLRRVKPGHTRRRRSTGASGVPSTGRSAPDSEAPVRPGREVDARLAALASFPEENPNAVIEITAAGAVTYMNPVARRRFPDLRREGFAHPILRHLDAIVAGRSHPAYVTREIEAGAEAYEQKICFTQVDGEVRLRIYAHDITRRKRAEDALHELAKRVVFAQEEERHRVSRELHDEAGQALTALKLSLELITADLPSDASLLRHNLQEAIALIDATRERIRSLARGLRPPSLDTLGLNPTLRALCRDFSRLTQIPVVYRGTEVSRVSAGATISLYRVRP